MDKETILNSFFNNLDVLAKLQDGQKIYLDKENSSRLENWQTAKLESIDKIIKVDPKFESFRLKNPSYDLYSDASAHCIQEVSFGVTIYQMIEINSSIRKNMKSATIN